MYKYYKHTVCDCKWSTKQHKTICPSTSSFAKARSNVCPCETQILTVVFVKTVLAMDIVPACCYEKDLQPKKSELPKSILPVKINWLTFFCSFWGGNKKNAEIRAGPLSHLITQFCMCLCSNLTSQASKVTMHWFTQEKSKKKTGRDLVPDGTKEDKVYGVIWGVWGKKVRDRHQRPSLVMILCAQRHKEDWESKNCKKYNDERAG